MFERAPATEGETGPGVGFRLHFRDKLPKSRLRGLPGTPGRCSGRQGICVWLALSVFGDPDRGTHLDKDDMASRTRDRQCKGNETDRKKSGEASSGTDLTERALSTGTHHAYRRALARFDDWCDGRPKTDSLLAEYLEVLFHRGLAPATASVVVAAVADRARREGAQPPLGKKTDQALSGFRRDGAGRGPGQVVGVSWDQADHMATLASRSCTGAAAARDALLLSISSDCMLRVAETSALDVADITFEDDWLRVIVRRSKSDQEARGTVLYAGLPTVRFARKWLRIAGIDDGPLFRPVNKASRVAGTRLSPRSMRDIVKRRAAQAGVQGRVSGHSLRVGAAQSLRDAGATTPELLAAGRWKRVETMASYTRTQEAAAGPVARLRYGVVPPNGRTPPNVQGGALTEAGRRTRPAASTAHQLKRTTRQMRRMKKATRRVEKRLARLEKAMLGSGKADLRNQSQPFDIKESFSIGSAELPSLYPRTEIQRKASVCAPVVTCCTPCSGRCR